MSVADTSSVGSTAQSCDKMCDKLCDTSDDEMAMQFKAKCKKRPAAREESDPAPVKKKPAESRQTQALRAEGSACDTSRSAALEDGFDSTSENDVVVKRPAMKKLAAAAAAAAEGNDDGDRDNDSCDCVSATGNESEAEHEATEKSRPASLEMTDVATWALRLLADAGLLQEIDSKLPNDGTLRTGSLCTGMGVDMMCQNAIGEIWSLVQDDLKLTKTVRFRHILMCEIKKSKREFLTKACGVLHKR